MAYAESTRHLHLGIKACIACLPVAVGGTIPFFGLTNLIWGSIFGFPGVWFHTAGIPHPPWTDVVWILGWPAIVVWLTGRAAGVIWSIGRPTRIAVALVYAVSLLALVPSVPTIMAPAGQPFAYEHWPLFLRLIEY
jgi:hypothetical protein